MRFRFPQGFVIACLLWIFSCSAAANSSGNNANPVIEPAQVSPLAPVILRVPINPFPPWVQIDKEGAHGIDVDILKAISSELGVTFRFIECPWLRCLKLMETGDADLMTGLFRSTERERFLKFIEPAYYEDPPKIFYTLKEDPENISVYEDLSGLTIGAIAGTLYFPRFDNDTTLNKMLVTEELQLIQLLNARRINTFVSTEVEADILIKKAQLTDRFVKTRLADSDSGFSYFALSRQSSLHILDKEIGRILKKLKASGQLDAIIENGLKVYSGNAE